MLETERTSLSAQNAAFQQQRAAFKSQLQQLSEETAVAAREQARARPAGFAAGRSRRSADAIVGE